MPPFQILKWRERRPTRTVLLLARRPRAMLHAMAPCHSKDSLQCAPPDAGALSVPPRGGGEHRIESVARCVS